MTRVLHLYSGNLYGGIERVLVTLARHRAVCPDVLPEFGLCFRGRAWDELAAEGVTLHDLGPVRASRPWSVLKARRRLAAVLQTGFSAAITHACWPHAVFAPVLRRAGVRTVNYVHDALNGKHWLERWAGRTPPDAVAANSNFTAATAPFVFGTTPTTVVYPPVELTRVVDPAATRARIRSELGTPADGIVILMASRLERWKGASVLVEAAKRLPDNAGVWIAGGPQRPRDGDYLSELRAAAPANVQFLGQRSDVPALLAACDIHCQPNTGPEPFGVAFVEALAAGKPVLTTNLGGGAEVVTSECGALVPAGDVPALAAVLTEWTRSRERREVLGGAGPARAAALADPGEQTRRLYGVALGP